MARRWSLLVRMGVALAVLTSFSIGIGLFVAAIGVLFGLIALGWLLEGLEPVSHAPGVTDFLALEPWLVAGATAAGLGGVVYGWPTIRQYTSATYLLEYHPVSLAATAFAVASLYLLVVEGSTALVQSLTTTSGVLFTAAVCAVLAVWIFVRGSQQELQRLRQALLEDTESAADVAPEAASITRRLAQLADVPTPEVRILESNRPEPFTIGSGETAVIIVSRDAQRTHTR